MSHAFFTHLHYHHCMDYGRLVLRRWDQGADRIPDLKVYGPSPIRRMTDHKDNAEVAKRAGVRTLVLTHQLVQIDQPRLREQIVHEIQEVFDGKVVWGEDLMRLTFAGPVVANIEGY